MTIAGFKSKNHPQQVHRRGADDTLEQARAEELNTFRELATEAKEQCSHWYPNPLHEARGLLQRIAKLAPEQP